MRSYINLMDHTFERVNSFVRNVEDSQKLQKRLLSHFPEFDISVLGHEETTGIEIVVYRKGSDRKLASTHVRGEDFLALPGGAADGVFQTAETLVGSSDLTIE